MVLSVSHPRRSNQDREYYLKLTYPEITLLQVVDKVATLVVESCDADLAVKDIGPLGLLVPVELANDAFTEAHIDTCQLNTSRQLSDSGLSSPSSFLSFQSVLVEGGGFGNGVSQL